MTNGCICNLFQNHECLVWVILALLIVMIVGCGGLNGLGCGC